MLNKRRKLDYRRAIEKLRREAAKNIAKHEPMSRERIYGDGYLQGLDDALHEFESYGKSEDEW